MDVSPIDPLIDAKEEYVYRDKDYYRAYHVELTAYSDAAILRYLYCSRHAPGYVSALSGQRGDPSALPAHDLYTAHQ